MPHLLCEWKDTMLMLAIGYLNAIGLTLGVAAAVCLYLGSRSFPEESWTRETEEEKQFEKRRSQFSKAGFMLLGAGFICQLVYEFIPSPVSN